MNYSSALIVGTGPGLSASLARLFAREGLRVELDRYGDPEDADTWPLAAYRVRRKPEG